MEEHLREDWDEREQKRKSEDAKGIRGVVHENNKNKRLSHVQNGNLMHHDEQELLSVWEGSIQSCAPGRDEKKWSTSVVTRCTQGSPEKLANVRLEGHPSGRRRTRDNQGSSTCARDGSRRNTRPTRGQSRPFEVLKVVLSEIATGKRGTGRRGEGVFLRSRLN